MRVTAELDGFRIAIDHERGRVERAITAAVAEATEGLKEDLRDQVRRAGLGERVAKTWRSEVYPKSGESLEPGGFIWSKAPSIIAGFAGGATISPKNSAYLAIPTDKVPRRRNRKRMSPEDVEAHFNQDLVLLPGRRGNLLGFVDVVQANSRRRPGYRVATDGRLNGRRGLAPRQRQMVLMFIFVRRAKLPRLLDLKKAASHWGARVPALFATRMR